MEPRRLKWNQEMGEASVPIYEADYELLECVAGQVGLSSEWLAGELFRAAIQKLGEGIAFTARTWEKDTKDLPRPVFFFDGNLDLTRYQRKVADR